jgi:hypothetical protein
MSEDQAKIYHLSHGADVVAQLIQIKDKSKKAGKFAKYITIFEEALLRLQTDPHGWGDPVYRSKTVDATAFRGIIRPVVFRYVIYEESRTVVLISVELFAEFD